MAARIPTAVPDLVPGATGCRGSDVESEEDTLSAYQERSRPQWGPPFRWPNLERADSESKGAG